MSCCLSAADAGSYSSVSVLDSCWARRTDSRTHTHTHTHLVLCSAPAAIAIDRYGRCRCPFSSIFVGFGLHGEWRMANGECNESSVEWKLNVNENCGAYITMPYASKQTQMHACQVPWHSNGCQAVLSSALSLTLPYQLAYMSSSI